VRTSLASHGPFAPFSWTSLYVLPAPNQCTSNVPPLSLTVQVQDGMKSVYNTPVVWSVYILNLVLKWIERQGGVEGMHMQATPLLLIESCTSNQGPVIRFLHSNTLPSTLIVLLIEPHTTHISSHGTEEYHQIWDGI